jgi:hypothetical protein
VRRKNFGLADLFGADFAGRIEPKMQNAYLRLEHATRHPILRGLEDAPRIIHGVSRVEIVPRDNTPSPLTLIPSYPDLPMEKVYPRVSKTDVPQVLLREFPKGGHVAYFPWDIDRTFWEVLCVDHFKLLRNAVAWAGNEPPVLEVAGPGVLDVTVWQQKNSLTVHLVNLSNPMMMKGPIREVMPIGEQQVRVRLPHGIKVKRVHLLAAEKSLRSKVDGEYLVVRVPTVLDHEVIAIDT